MLVLDARVGDTIFIGDNVAVTVLREVGSGKFKLGFTAPNKKGDERPNLCA